MRKTIFWLHLVTGVLAGLVILVMSVTGVLLMYQRQITTWADGARVTPPSAGAQRLPIETVLARWNEREPKLPSSVTISSDPRAAITLAFGREKILFVDPYTADIVSEGSAKVRAFFQSMIDWHRWLAMSGENRPIGKAITGACNMGFLFLVVSGFYLWWPRNWSWNGLRAVISFDFSLSGKARDWNWHNAAGFWSALPLAIVVFTATFFSYPWATDLLYRATGNEPPPKPAGPARTENRASPEKPPADTSWNLAGVNAAWNLVEQQMPGWKTITLRLPVTGSLHFTADRGHGARPDLRAQFTIDPKTNVIAKTETYGSYNAARRIRLWIRWIHTGEAGGFVGQTIAGLASAAGALLVWTGFALAFRRFTKRKGETSP